MATGALSSAIPSLVDQIRSSWGGYGEWNAGGVDRAQELADLLGKAGITRLGDLSLANRTRKVAGRRLLGGSELEQLQWGEDGPYLGGQRVFMDDSTGQTTYYIPEEQDEQYQQLQMGDRSFGFLGDYNRDGSFGTNAAEGLQSNNRAAWSSRGDGNVTFDYKVDPKTGRGYIAPTWHSSSDADNFRNAAKAAAIMGGVGYGISALAGGGLSGGALGGGSAAEGVGLTGAGELGGAGAAEAAGAAAGGSGATNMALIESALGTSGYGASSAGAGGAAAAGGALASAVPGYAAPTNAALIESSLGTAGYGASSAGAGNALSAAAGGLGMTGAQTAAYDSVLGITGSKTLADMAAGSGLAGLVSQMGNSLGLPGVADLIGGSNLGRDLLGMASAGIQQWNLERMAAENRKWQDQREAAARRRRAPVRGTAGALRVVRGG